MKANPIHLLALLPFAAASAREPGDRDDRRPPPVPPILALFDADRDGVISADEIEKASDSLGKLDQNGDGEITRDELRPPPPQDGDGEKPKGPPPGKLPPPPVIAALDSDKDGTISAEEMEAAPESLKEVDVNGDGELSPEELHPHGPPPPREGGPGGGRRPPGPPPADEEPAEE